jgi:hypothetical protein
VFLGEGTHKLKTGGATGVPDRHRQHRRVLGRIRLKRFIILLLYLRLYDFELCVCVYMWLIFIKFMCFFVKKYPTCFLYCLVSELSCIFFSSPVPGGAAHENVHVINFFVTGMAAG